jgi:myo-inositol-1(or 4)-monophosphatase
MQHGESTQLIQENMIESEFLEGIYEIAVHAAYKAGIAIGQVKEEGIVRGTLEDHDVKLEADAICEEQIIECIQSKYSRHWILSEEAGLIEGEEDYLWIIDPVDGSVNFYHDIPLYAVSIACYKKPQGTSLDFQNLIPLIGLVYLPDSEEMWTASLNSGLFLNGERWHRKQQRTMAAEIANVSISSKDDVAPMMAKLTAVLASRMQKVRNFGVTALDMCYAASGRVGVFLQASTNLWDFAAGYILAKEAGLEVSVEEYRTGKYRIAVCPPEFVRTIQEIVVEESEGIWKPFDM